MRKLTIYRYYFRDSDCYQTATVQEQRGVQVHCTVKGASYLKRWVGPDDGRLGQNPYGNYHNRPGGDVCASAYIGKLADKTVACYQSLPWDYRTWLSSSDDNGNANRMGYIGFEIAADNLDNETYFREAVMGVSVNLTAHLCKMLGTTPYTVVQSFPQGDALAVMDHSELHRVLVANNHSDISHWLKKFGLTMGDYRAAVAEAMEEGVEVTYIDAAPASRPTIRKGSRGEDVRDLQTYLNADRRYGGLEVDGIFGRGTEAAVRAFQGDHGLTPDGIVGPKTWALIEGTKPPEDTAHQAKETPQGPAEDSPEAARAWDSLTLEEKVEDLNERLKRQEGGTSDG